MKKKLMLGIALATVGAMAAPAMAQTSVTTTWNGAGNVGVNASATGASSAYVQTGGNIVIGSANFTNAQDNPYGYGVNTTDFDVNSVVGNGGVTTFGMQRTGSQGMYGPAGQSITGSVSSYDGAAAAVFHGGTNYAAMSDLGYGQARTASGNSLEASGSNFAINYGVNTGVAGNNGGISVVGNGSAAVTQNFTGVNAGGFSLANGGGIYTLANVNATGVGQVSYGGVSTNQLTVHGTGNTVLGTDVNPASFTATINYGAGLTWNNFSVSGVSGPPATP